MDLDHYSWRKLLGGNYIAPIENPSTILDLGTGTGVWVMEMADEFPNAHLIGVDMFDIMPNDVLPNNCEFQIMNVLYGLPFHDDTIDYVHHRYLFAIPLKDWPNYLADCVRIVRHGGWLEVMETDSILYNTGPYGRRFNNIMKQFLGVYGVSWQALKQIGTWMSEEPRLTNVRIQSYEVALCPSHPSEHTRCNKLNCTEYICDSTRFRRQYNSIDGSSDSSNDNSVCLDSDIPRCTSTTIASPARLEFLQGGFRWTSFYESMTAMQEFIERDCNISREEWLKLIDNIEAEAYALGTYTLHLVIIGQKQN
jgi:ubiquinone/menaquinone biosynthesis C-methylase UbiE